MEITKRSYLSSDQRTSFLAIKKRDYLFDRCRRGKNTIQKVDALLGKIKTNSITDTNNLIYADAVVARELLGIKMPSQINKREPWWERGLEGQVEEMLLG